MEEIKLTLGSKLELELYDDNGERIKPVLVSQFETLLPNGSMEILAPIHEGRFFTIHRETQMDVIYEENGDLFKFLAVVLEQKVSGNIHLLKIQPRSGAERVQRRTFYRFNCLLDINYRFFDKNADKKEALGEFKKAVTKDLSGGGMLLLLNEKPVTGWFLEGVIKVGREVRFKGHIVRVIKVEGKGKFNYETGVEFINITNMDRERIISFIFDQQRKLLNKGWHTK